MAGGNGYSETDLYVPVREFLAVQGYTVQGEVRKSDVAAVRGEELVVVELKLRLNTAVLVQAGQRQQIADRVYVAVPRPSELRQWRARSRDLLYLLRRLELGLLLVAPKARKNPKVAVEQEPMLFDRVKSGKLRSQVVRETTKRRGSHNVGGSPGTRIISAYRECAVHIVCCLVCFGPLTAAQLRALGTGRETFSILQRGVDKDGWFSRGGDGMYDLTNEGARLPAKYPEVSAPLAAQLEHRRKP